MIFAKRTKSPSTLSWIWHVAGKRKLYIGILLLVQIVLGISGVGYALFLRGIIDAAVAKDKASFLVSALLFVSLVVFQIALRAVNRFLEEYSRSTMENQLKERLFSALLKKDYAAVTAVHSGEWMNRLTSDTVVVTDGLVQIIPGVAGMLARMIGAMVTLLVLEPRFGYIILIGGILLIILTGGFRKVLKRLHKKIQEADGRLRVFFQERLSSLMIVRTFAQEKSTIDQAMEYMDGHKAARMKRNWFSNLCNIGFGAAMNGAYVFGAIFCGYGILTGTMTYGTFTAVLQLISQVQNPFANITGYVPKYYAMLASAERLMEAENFEEDCTGDTVSEEEIKDFYKYRFAGMGLKNAGFTYQPPVQNQSLDCEKSSVQNQSPRYEQSMESSQVSDGSKEGNPSMPVVLSGLNLKIRKGEYVAFTGPSGCGKSTVLKLLMCLYPLDEGERYLISEGGNQEYPVSTDKGERANLEEGKKNVDFIEHKLPLTSAWRGLFAYVPQGNQLLSGTIREIIAFGDTELMKQEERMKRALHIACADEFVCELEKGLDTLLGERGTGLSEGQMQRIAIARAIFSDHPILLLDEATSSLDEVTEAKLLANLRAMTDKTVLIVTHRPAVLSITDKVVDFGSGSD